MTIPFTIRGHHMATTTAGGLIRTPCGIHALGIHQANRMAASGHDVAADTAARLRTPDMLAFLVWLKTALPRLSYRDALGILKELGFLAACLERQVTAVHGAQGAGGAFRLFPELEPTLLGLGPVSGVFRATMQRPLGPLFHSSPSRGAKVSTALPCQCVGLTG